jgi:hypothetical protein
VQHTAQASARISAATVLYGARLFRFALATEFVNKMDVEMGVESSKVAIRREHRHVQQFFVGRGEEAVVSDDEAYLTWWKTASKEDILALFDVFVRPIRPVVGYLPDPEGRCPVYFRLLESAPPPEMNGKHVKYVMAFEQGTSLSECHRIQITIYETVRDDPARGWGLYVNRRDKSRYCSDVDPDGW